MPESLRKPPPLLCAINAESQVHLIIGSNPLASSRCTKCLEIGAIPILIALTNSKIPSAISDKVGQGLVRWIQRDFQDSDLSTLGRNEVDCFVDAVFVTLERSDSLTSHISKLCRKLRIPVNVADCPDLCTFTLLSTYSDGPVHIGVTTSGRGGSIASRIRREISSFLPSNLGAAVESLGNLRRRIWEEDGIDAESSRTEFYKNDDDATAQDYNFNSLVTSEDPAVAKTRRIRWLSQICEYWPLRRIAAITLADVDRLLADYEIGKSAIMVENGVRNETLKRGKIILAGSGPGHPDLITRAAYQAIKTADLILSDKLVPSAVLDLIPRRTEVHIARKFPGNADKAQEELLTLALEGLSSGKAVLRLKQGDPYLYGRGAEEFEFFKQRGFDPIVIPGITSALSAPLFADIPATHRGVADQVLVCTGTGRHGTAPAPPSYSPSQTVVFLMALHRLSSLIESMTKRSPEPSDATGSFVLWPLETPCAVIERASSSDQRVIRSTLQHICLAIQEEGSRPPGLLVVGKSCEVLRKTDQKWSVEDGFKTLDGIGDSYNFDTINDFEGNTDRII